MARAELAREPDRAGDVDAGGAAEQQALLTTRSKMIGSASSSGIWKAKSTGAPSRLAVTRPWPIPSVTEEPELLSPPVV